MLNKKKYIKPCMLLAGSLIVSFHLTAQAGKDRYDYDFLKYSDAWLTGENAAGLDNFTVQKISVAELNGNKGNGNFINYYESNNSYQYGASCESFYRFNPNTVVFGKVEYSKFSGANMGGATSIDPYYNVFNIVEYTDSTAGRTYEETYHLIGALSTKLTNHLLLGIKGDYTTISYYKTKDLRHTNDYMNLVVTGGFRYNDHRKLDIGINYYFRRSTEGISFQSLGTTNQQFNSLIDFGAFYGQQERFGENGYTYGNNLFVNQFHGAALQINLFPQSNISFYNELAMKFRNGYYGVKASTSVEYTDHHSNIFSYTGVVSLKSATSLQQLKLQFNSGFLKNYAYSYRAETTPGGSTTYVYYGKNEVLDQNKVDFSAGYTGNFNIKDNNPQWTFDALFSAKTNNQIVSVYPTYRKQEINQFLWQADAKRNFYMKEDIVRIKLNLGYGFGTGYAAEDGNYVSAASAQSAAVSLDNYLYREYDYLTARRLTGGVAVRYTKLLPQTQTSLYGEIGYESTKAFSVNYIGNYFGSFSLKIGYLF